MTREQKLFRNMVEKSKNIVFLGGAGVSTESGIPDFRSAAGLYNKKNTKYNYPPEIMLSHRFFINHTKEFYQFYKTMLFFDAKPNITHFKLAELEKEGKLKAVITQNIDGLHQKAGSKNVLEVHGSIYRNYCMNCGKAYTAAYVSEAVPIPRCEKCGGIIKPDVVLYEEALNTAVLGKAVDYIEKADMFIVGGTSLVVYPAAGLVDYYHGNKLVIISGNITPRDRMADLAIHAGLGETFDCL